jgi:hypothetical protein
MNEDLTILFTFFDAIRASEACRHLETASIRFYLEDRGTPNQGLNDWNDAPSVYLDVSVHPQDLTLARKLLQATMHLFPERETPLSSRTDEEGEDVQVEIAICDTEEDASAIAAMLASSGIASNTIRPEDPDTTCFTIEVLGVDAERASLALDRWPS